MKTDIEVLSIEVAHLKRNLARQRWANVGLLTFGLIGFGAISAKTQTPAQPVLQELVVKSLKVVDEGGKERVFIGTDKLGGRINFKSRTGKSAAYIGEGEEGGVVEVSSPDTGESLAFICAMEESAAIMLTHNKSGPGGVFIMGTADGGTVAVRDKDSKILFHAPASKD